MKSLIDTCHKDIKLIQMKQIIQTIWIVVTIVWLSISVSAYDFEIDGIRYNLISATDLTVETTESQESISKENNSLTIPDEIEYNNRLLKVVRVGANSFKGCVFKQVTIGSNVEEIGENAFANNDSLESADGTNVLEIAEGAFANCSLLSNIKLGEKISIIGNRAFYGCTSLTNINLPESLRKIGEYGFSESGIVTFSIPPDTEIGQYGFCGCQNLTSFYFNGGILSFPIGLFKDCINLSELINFNVPSTLPSYAFSHCKSLDIQQILDSSTLRNIGAYSLEYCKFGDNLEIGSFINNIDAGAFAGFEGNVLIRESNRRLEIGNNSFNQMIIYELSVGRDLSTWCINFPSSLKKLSIGKSVSIISNVDLEQPSALRVYPFQNCCNLKEIHIENASSSLIISGGGRETNYERNAADYSDCYYYYYYSGLFSDCPLEKLYIGRPISFIDEKGESSKRTKWYWDYYYYYYDKPFSGIKTLKEIEGDYNSFDYIPLSPSIECLSIGLNVDSIPDMSTCNLKDIDIATPNPPIAGGFSAKTYLDGVLTVPAGSDENYKKANIWENFWNIEVNNSIFVTDDLLYKVIQDSEVQLVSCRDLNKEELSIPSEVEDNGIVYKVTSIGDKALYSCSNLHTVSIPESVTSLGNSIFNPIAPLKILELEDSDQSLYIPNGSMAFEEKDLGTTIDGHSVYYDLTIYNGYFNGLPIENLYIGRNLSSEDPFILTEGGRFEEIANAKYYNVTIFEEPFSKLSKLEKLTIGQNVNTLGSSVREIEEVGLLLHTGSFEKCEAIKNVLADASVPPTGAIFTEAVYAEATLTVPENSKESYQEAEGWKEFKNIFDGTEPMLVEEIKLNANEVSLEVGDTFQLTAEVLPEDASDQTIIWESSNPKCVAVDENGLLTALSEGSVTIVARSADGNCEASCIVTVTPVDDYVDIVGSGDAVYTVYNLQGIKVLESAGKDKVYQLPTGTYVINGKKTKIITFR